MTLALAATLGVAGAAQGAIVINEIDSDTANTPSTDYLEFIELYSTTGTATPLDGLVLVLINGNGDVSYGSIDLDGLTTDANGYFVFGAAGFPGANNTTFLNNPANPGGAPGNFLQNGADAVALYLGDATSYPNGTAATTTNLVDAIVYDTNDADDAGLLAALGQTVEYDELGGAGGTSDSLARVPNGSGTFVAQAPTPGAVNIIPEPASVGLVGLAGGLLAARRRNRK
jgi:hypothetical protein